MDSNMPLPLDGLVNAAFGVVIVAVVSEIDLGSHVSTTCPTEYQSSAS